MKDVEALDTTVEEWRVAIDEASGSSAIEGKTAIELAEEYGCSGTWMRKKLNKMIELGRCKRMRGRRVASDGRTMPVNVYQLRPKKEKK